jgi:HEAT repeat protein
MTRSEHPDPPPYELVAALYRSPGLRFWHKGAQLTALAAIVSDNLWTALPYIAPLLGSLSEEIRTEAAKAVAVLLESDLAFKLGYLSSGLGRLLPNEFQKELQRIDRSKVFSLQAEPDVAWAVFGLISFHPNGWVRETAVERLGMLIDGCEIPFLLVRANDWVKVITERARALVEERIRNRPVQQLTRWLTTVYAFRSRMRGPIGILIEQLVARVAKEESPEVIFEMSARAGGGFRRWLLRDVFLPNVPETRTVLVELLASDEDPIVRLMAWEKAVNASSLSKIKLAEAGLRDEWPPLRRRALEVLFEDNTLDRSDILFDSLLDRASSVRAAARYYLEKNTSQKAVDYYRRCVRNNPQPRVAALVGLGETGDATDAIIIGQFLDSGRVALRRAAVLAVGRLDPDSYRAELLSALNASSPGVSKAAREVLSRHPSFLSRLFLLSLASSVEKPAHVRRYSLVLIRVLPKWDHILAYLEMLRQTNEFHAEVISNIRRWLFRFNFNLETPSKAALAELQREAQANAKILGKRLTEELLSIATSTPTN